MSTVDRVCHTGAQPLDASSGDDGHVDVSRAAKLLGLQPTSVYSAIRDGQLIGVLIGGHRYVPTTAIEEYLTRPSVLARRERDASPKPSTAILPGRFPLEPLAFLIEQHEAEPAPLTVLADRIGVARAAIYRLLREGLTATMADHCAVTAGWHPALVWGMDWWDEDRHAVEASRRSARAASMRRHPSSRRHQLGQFGDLPPAA